MHNYRIDIEIFEGKGGKLQKKGNEMVIPDFGREGICAWMYRGDGQTSYQAGRKFVYPDDTGKMCPWLLNSLYGFIQALKYGGILPWYYKGTPYEKAIDAEGVTTEFVRCPDPTGSGIVVKLIRTKI